MRAAGDRERSLAPVVHTGSETWDVLGHAAVVEAASDVDRFSSAVSAHLQVPNGLEGEHHTEFRALIDRYFTQERTAAAEPLIRTVARDLVDELIGRDATDSSSVRLDAVTDLGAVFAVRVQTRWLGWPESLEPELLRWMGENQAAAISGNRSEKVAVAEHFDEIIRSLLAPRRAASATTALDLTAELIADDSLGRPLTDEELISILRNWTGGDLGSLALCAGVILQFLAAHQPVQTQIRGGVEHGALAAMIDEMLRIDDPFVSSRRATTCPLEIGGVSVPAGGRLRLDWTSANRDASVFDDPDAFEPVANAGHNLVYGTGAHVCPGRGLATTELCILVQELLSATARIEPDPDAGPVRSTPPLGGYERVPLVLLR